MPYPYLPRFNLVSKIWRPPNEPPAPESFTTESQFYIPSRGLLDITPRRFELWHPPVYLRCPVGTILVPHDIVEVEAGDGYYYVVRWVDRMHRGFPNEYVVAILEQQSLAPPVPAGAIMLENGTGFVLLEDGGDILLES